MAVSDFPNGQAPHDALVVVEDMWVDPDEMAPRVRFLADYLRERGVYFRGNQGYRWLGAPSDRYVRDSAATSDGTANQYYVKGVEDRGGASAATPGYSNHGKGRSIDSNAGSISVRDEGYRLVGMRRDIPSESWHGTIEGPPLVDLGPWRDKPDTSAADAAAAKAALEKKRRQNVALPLIAQQEVPGDDQYGLNIIIWDDGTYYWVDAAQRDVWIDAGSSFIHCTIPGRFEYLVFDAEMRKALHKNERMVDAQAGAKGAFAALSAAARSAGAPLLLDAA